MKNLMTELKGKEIESSDYDDITKKDLKRERNMIFLFIDDKLNKFEKKHAKENNYLEIEILLKKMKMDGTLK